MTGRAVPPAIAAPVIIEEQERPLETALLRSKQHKYLDALEEKALVSSFINRNGLRQLSTEKIGR